MILLIECIIACIIFTLIILPSLYKNPLKHILSYPTEIRKRVESLPQYQDTITTFKNRHLAKKIIAALLFSVMLAIVAYFSGAKTFTSAYTHVFIIFFIVNVYDALILDIGIFCHSKRARIPGTEDMDKEYKSPWYHIKGAGYGIILGALISLLSAGIIQLTTFLR